MSKLMINLVKSTHFCVCVYITNGMHHLIYWQHLQRVGNRRNEFDVIQFKTNKPNKLFKFPFVYSKVNFLEFCSQHFLHTIRSENVSLILTSICKTDGNIVNNFCVRLQTRWYIYTQCFGPYKIHFSITATSKNKRFVVQYQ